MMTPQQRARAGFRAVFGEEAEGVCFAPGRVNLIGDHVDYNDGLVLPMPISTGTAVAWSRHHRPAVEAVAIDLDGDQARFPLTDLAPQQAEGWHGYLRGMAASMIAGDLPVGGARLAIAGNLPRGAGLSSSASLCIGIGQALLAAAGAGAQAARNRAQELALAAQQAEHQWAGVQCGIMDQLSIAAGTPGVPVLIDCRDLSCRHVPLPEHWGVVIVQSGVVRGLVDGEYNARRADCRNAAGQLGRYSLRDVREDDPAVQSLEPLLARRARHVTGEIARVETAVRAILAQDIEALGAAMNASHQSLRDDFAVSHPDVDRLVAALQSAIGSQGGARMTGGGFGGAVIAVAERAQIDRITRAVEAAYRPPGGAPLEITVEATRTLAAGGFND